MGLVRERGRGKGNLRSTGNHGQKVTHHPVPVLFDAGSCQGVVDQPADGLQQLA